MSLVTLSMVDRDFVYFLIDFLHGLLQRRRFLLALQIVLVVVLFVVINAISVTILCMRGLPGLLLVIVVLPMVVLPPYTRRLLAQQHVPSLRRRPFPLPLARVPRTRQRQVLIVLARHHFLRRGPAPLRLRARRLPSEVLIRRLGLLEIGIPLGPYILLAVQQVDRRRSGPTQGLFV